MSSIAVILPAAGQSTRLTGFPRKKPFIDLHGIPVWLRTARHFLNRADVVQTVLIVSPDDLDWFMEAYRATLASLEITIVAGGKSRAESVRNGLQSISSTVDLIAVHDAARPMLTPQWIDQIFAAAAASGAAIPGLRISSTVKRVANDHSIVETVDRTHLVLAQTPQVFRRSLLLQAFKSCRNLVTATDEASLVEQLGHPVQVIDGWPMNIKITTQDDFQLAELFVSALANGVD